MTVWCVTMFDIPSDSALLITHADTSKRTFCKSQRISNVLTRVMQSEVGSTLPMIRGLASHGEAYSPAAPCTLAIIPRFSDRAMCVNTSHRGHRYALFQFNDATATIPQKHTND